MKISDGSTLLPPLRPNNPEPITFNKFIMNYRLTTRIAPILPLLPLALAMALCDAQIPASPSPIAASAKPTTTASSLEAAYARATLYGDAQSAAVIACQLVDAMPEKAATWKEELAKIYFTTRRLASCERVCDDLIQNHGATEKAQVLEMRAISLEGTCRKEDAIKAWRGLWEKTPNASHAVRLAGLQFETGGLDDADKTIAAALALKDVEEAKITLPKSPSQMQQIPAAAALHNLKALLLMKRDPKAKDAAKAELEIALKLSPDFELAKRNLKGLETPKKEQTPKEEAPVQN